MNPFAAKRLLLLLAKTSRGIRKGARHTELGRSRRGPSAQVADRSGDERPDHFARRYPCRPHRKRSSRTLRGCGDLATSDLGGPARADVRGLAGDFLRPGRSGARFAGRRRRSCARRSLRSAIPRATNMAAPRPTARQARSTSSSPKRPNAPCNCGARSASPATALAAPCQMAYPIVLADKLYGVVALELAPSAVTHFDLVLRLAQWGIAWFARIAQTKRPPTHAEAEQSRPAGGRFAAVRERQRLSLRRWKRPRRSWPTG